LSETDLRSTVVFSLNATGRCRVWSVHAGRVRVRGGWMHLCPVGTSDVIGFEFDSARIIAIEIKVAGNKTDPARAKAQLAFREEIARHGGITGVATSVAEALSIVARATGRAA
jgi:hypothetical protein